MESSFIQSKKYLLTGNKNQAKNNNTHLRKNGPGKSRSDFYSIYAISSLWAWCW